MLMNRVYTRMGGLPVGGVGLNMGRDTYEQNVPTCMGSVPLRGTISIDS